MEDLIQLLVGNLGIAVEDLILLITILGSTIFAAKDLRIGIIILLILVTSEYMIFVSLEMESFKALMAMLTAIVILTLSLYITHSKSGGII